MLCEDVVSLAEGLRVAGEAVQLDQHGAGLRGSQSPEDVDTGTVNLRD